MGDDFKVGKIGFNETQSFKGCENCVYSLAPGGRAYLSDDKRSWICPECGWCNELETNPLEESKAGLKHDDGKIRPRLIFEGFSRALSEVAKVGTFGANKYTENGWETVENGVARYTDAKYRHQLAESMGEELDPESKLKHAAHEAWNTLARLELMLREEDT